MGSLVLPDRIWPEWKMGGEFLEAHWERALNLDCKRSSHPIQVECPDSNKISSIFDAISYSKGASVLRMLMYVVGEEKFFKGVSLYLKKHLYGNAEMQDLWDGISAAVGKDVREMMESWTLRVGFPVVRVDEVGDGKIKLSQHRFLSTGDVKPDEDETVWWVPLEIKSVGPDGATVDHDAILSTRESTYSVKSDTFKLNGDIVGVYRVQYSPERLAKLGEQAASFSVADRLGLMSDAASIAAAGYSKTSGALNLAAALAKSERELLPYSRIATFLGSIAGAWWENDSVHDAINRLRIAIFRPVVDRMGYDYASSDTPEVRELRTLAISVCARAGDKDVIAALQERFNAFVGGKPMVPDLQESILRTAAQNGGEKEYEALLGVYNNPAVPAARVDAIRALGAVRDPKLLQRTVDMIGSDAVKDQDVYIFFVALGANRAAKRIGADYLMERWGELNKRFHASYGLKNAIAFAFGGLSSHEDLAKVEAFVKANGELRVWGGGSWAGGSKGQGRGGRRDVQRHALTPDTAKYDTIIDQAIEGIRARADWVKRDTDDVSGWLKENKYL